MVRSLRPRCSVRQADGLMFASDRTQSLFRELRLGIGLRCLEINTRLPTSKSPPSFISRIVTHPPFGPALLVTQDPKRSFDGR
jgi:hypothetical protein